jgi:uncharacterized protein YgiM (DUF1202 family)
MLQTRSETLIDFFLRLFIMKEYLKFISHAGRLKEVIMYKSIVLSLVFLIALVSCIPSGLSDNTGSDTNAIKTSQAQTQAAAETDSAAVLQTQEAAARQTDLAHTIQTQTVLAAVTPTPSLTPTPTEVVGTANANFNCRSGPHGNFDLIQVVAKDTSFKVIGKNTDLALWFQIEIEDTTCWVSGDLITLAGSLENVPEVASPPIPTAFYSAWVGTWTAWQNQCTGSASSGCINTFILSFTMTDSKTVVGSYSTGGCNFTDVLTLSADGMRLDGPEYAYCSGTALNFEVHLVMNPNLNQFTGKWNFVGAGSADGYFKGARNGYPKP